MTAKETIPLLKKTYSSWSDHNAPRLGASVAFYSILSIAPLLLLVTAIIGLVFGGQGAHNALVGEARQVMGNHGAETVDSLLKSAHKPASGAFASVIAFITLLFGASGVFTELQAALNIMWDAPQQTSSGFLGMIKQKLFSFGMVLSVGFLLLISLLLSSGLAAMGTWFSNLLPIPAPVLELFNFIVSFVVIAGLFALMFKYVPNAKIAWREVIVGAIGTALLFTIGKLLLGLYLAKAGVGSTYGAAGSLVAVVVWIYYSAQIFFFGAEFTHVYADEDRAKAAAESKTAHPSARAHPMPQVASTATAAAERPKAMAAAAAASSTLPAQSPAAAPVVTPAQPAAALPIPPLPAQAQPAVAAVTKVKTTNLKTTGLQTSPHLVTTPRLLMAAVAGFAIGRVAEKIEAKRAASHLRDGLPG